MAFSGALTLTDLNDFITPGQACIKPVEVKQTPPSALPGAASTEIQIDSKGAYYEVSTSSTSSTSTTAATTTTITTNEGASSSHEPQKQKLQRAEISLTDCLACSGCITSAESVLITLQSHEEVLSVLRSNPPPGEEGHKIPVMSIAPQVLASLAATLAVDVDRTQTQTQTQTQPFAEVASVGAGVGLHRVLARIRAFVKLRLGFAYVFDTSFARHVVLREHVREFGERSAAAAAVREGKANGKEMQLPMLASACPGWVCYAEKAHGQLLPFVSTTKSPQQVMGTIVKRWLAGRAGKRPDEIYHVAVMPCYDKKLEASRQDFYDEQYRTRDVDCVITTGELEILMQENGWDLHVPVEGEEKMESYLPKSADDSDTSSSISSVRAPSTLTSLSLSSLSSGGRGGTRGHGYVSDLELEIPELVQHLDGSGSSSSSSSGGWLQTIIAHVQELEAARGRQTAVRSRTIRTGDYEEFSVESFVPAPPHHHESEVVFRGAKCYGFRNLQNVVRKVGREAGVRVGAGAAGRLQPAPSGGGGGNGANRVALRARRARQKAGPAAGAEGDEERESGSGGRTVKGEDRPYDYVEVMACPAGCVNGGGQARRKIQSRDGEGYARIWEADGVEVGVGVGDSALVVDKSNNGDTAGMGGARWGDREWVKTVELAYWRTGADEQNGRLNEKLEWADSVVESILEEMYRDEDGKLPSDEERSTRRVGMLRTQYRAVVSEVIGLAVKW